METSLHVGDIVVIGLYLVGVLFIGLWSSRQNRGSAKGYFLAGRSMHWLPVGASLFVSNIGSLHFIGLAGSGAAGGIAVCLYELLACISILLLGFYFLPIYIASGVTTMPEYLRKRYGGRRIQVSLSILVLLNYIFTKISLDLYAGAIFLKESLQWNLYLSITILIAVATVFTITGGLTAVIWTDTIQTGILLIGSCALMILSFKEVGGYNNMVRKYERAIPNTTLSSNATCGLPRKDYMHLWRDPIHGDFPWPGVIGQSISSIWYWCNDQVIVQRALAAKTFDHAKGGSIFCGFLKLLPLFLIVFPGMIARILFPDTVGCTDPDLCEEICGSRAGCSNLAYPKLVLHIMPVGARGLMLAVVLSGVMTSLTSIFNSSSTIFAMDLWGRLRKKPSELEIMFVGRIFVIFAVAVSIAWIPVVKEAEGSQIFMYVNSVASIIQPPIAASYILGTLWGRTTEQGAFWSLVVGMLFGLSRFIVDMKFPMALCTDNVADERPWFVKDIHFLNFAALSFLVTTVTAIVISLLTEPIDKRSLRRVTWWTRNSKEPRLEISDMSSDNCFSCCTQNKQSASLADHNEKQNNQETSNTTSAMTFTSVPTPVEASSDKLMAGTHMGGNASGGEAEVIRVIQPCVLTGPVDERAAEPNAMPISRRVINLICGVNEGNRHALAHRSLHSDDMLSIAQKSRWKLYNNVAAVILLVIIAFMFGFYA